MRYVLLASLVVCLFLFMTCSKNVGVNNTNETRTVPAPAGLTVSYDTLRQTVILTWTGVDTSMIAGYNVYRAIKGQNFSLITQTPVSKMVTTFRDSAVSVGNTYAYTVVSWMASGQESPKVATPGDTIKAVSSSLVTTTFTWNLSNTISDTACINDTIMACLVYLNPTRKITKIVWYADSLNSPIVKQISDSLLAGKDTLAYSWKQPGNKKIFVKVTDGAGTVWTDSVGLSIIQDVPTVSISGKDTAAPNAPVTFTVQTTQEFGHIIEYLWDNGVAPGYDDSTGPTYTFSYQAEGTFTVKVQVMDNYGNTNTATKTILIRTYVAPAFAASQGSFADKVLLSWRKPLSGIRVIASKSDSTGTSWAAICTTTVDTVGIDSPVVPGPHLYRLAVTDDSLGTTEYYFANGYRSVTDTEFFIAMNATVKHSQAKLTKFGSLGSEQVQGDTSGTLTYNAAMNGLLVNISIVYVDYRDFYLTLDGTQYTVITNILSQTGTVTDTVFVTGIYPGTIVYNLTVSGGKPTGGTYTVIQQGRLPTVIQFADVSQYVL